MRRLMFLLTILFFNFSFAQSTDEIAKAAAIINRYDQPNAPGFSFGIVKKGQLIYSGGVGLAHLDQSIRNSDSSIFNTASIAKQFTAACIWNLTKTGEISLDDDIRKYIPEFPAYGEVIRIRHLLNHTSGIRNYHAIMELSGFDYDHVFHDNQMILDLACRQKGLNNSPGEKVVYGNTAYTLLAIIIERITGKNLNQYARDQVFMPLGMNHTFYRMDTTSVVDQKVQGYYTNENNTYIPVVNHQVSYGAGSVCSSITDLATWSRVLNGENPDYKDLTNFLTTSETLPSGEILKYARGVMVDEYKGFKTVHHSGYHLGGQAEIIAIPELQLAMIVLTNLESINPSSISYAILDLFLPAQPRSAIELSPIFQHKKRQLNKFSGQYKEQNSDMRMEFFLENDTLKAMGSLGKKPVSLVSTGKGKFMRSNSHSVRYDFTCAKGTNADLIIYFGGTPFYFSKASFVDPQTIDLSAYVGRYYAAELLVEYEIYMQDNNLFVQYANRKIKLNAGQKDEFGNGQRVLYHFERNRKNEVTKFYLSAEGTVSNIEFNRISVTAVSKD